jgi:hypothetical protein
MTLKPIGWSDVDKSAEEDMYYLQSDLPTACFAHSTFAHATSLRAMAARVLCAGKNEELESCLL